MIVLMAKRRNRKSLGKVEEMRENLLLLLSG